MMVLYTVSGDAFLFLRLLLLMEEPGSKIRPKNKALFPAHRVTKKNVMRAVAKIFFLENV
jgi:hypothetical protein